MSEGRLIHYLKIVGWITISAYPLFIIVRIIDVYQLSQSFETSNNYFFAYAGAHVIRAIIDSPIALALPVLCLFSAAYLNKQSKILNDTFELKS